MKKMLILFLILGVASLANAGLQISVHEVGGGEYNGRTLQYSDELWLDVTAEPNLPSADYAYIALVCDTTLGTISGGQVSTAGQVVGNLNEIYDPASGYITYFRPPVLPSEDGLTGSISDSGGATLIGVQLDQILFHCEGIDDVTIKLYGSPNFSDFTLLDSVVIPQVPEPATVLLLSLGGLLLKRKK